MIKIEVREYCGPTGAIPFRAWLDGCDRAVKIRIQARIQRFETGNLGDFRHLGEGLCEARFAFGPGYRLYFGMVQNKMILLLCGGEKTRQDKDIVTAKKYWREYQKGE